MGYEVASLMMSKANWGTEEAVYRKLVLKNIPSELREGNDEIQFAAAAAQEKGYEFLGITDHSQSLTIAGGVSEADLSQIRFINKLNAGRGIGPRILKSGEVGRG